MEGPTSTGQKIKDWFWPGLAVALLVYMWAQVLAQASTEWITNPQYAYGWAVPVLTMWLLWRRLKQLPDPGNESRLGLSGLGPGPWRAVPIAAGLGIVYAVTRFVQEPNSDWRYVSWALAGSALGLSWLIAGLACGMPVLRRVWIVLAFVLVAVPWPSIVEVPFTRWLSGFVARVGAELLTWLGVPALRTGNAIALATGSIGIEDACSGIRSLQACIVISLFFGEFYLLRTIDRLLLAGLGVIIAFVFEVLRTVLLGLVGAKTGIAKVAELHDPVGVAVLVVAFMSLWVCGLWLFKPGAQKRTGPLAVAHAWRKHLVGMATRLRHASGDPRFRAAVALSCCVIVAGELLVARWYAPGKRPSGPGWSVRPPSIGRDFSERSLPVQIRRLLRPSEWKDWTWEIDGVRSQLLFLVWKEGRTSANFANAHVPDICLVETGFPPDQVTGPVWVDVNGWSIPFKRYVIYLSDGGMVVLYYTLYAERRGSFELHAERQSLAGRMRPVLQRVPASGYQALYVSVSGTWDVDAADTLFRRIITNVVTGPHYADRPGVGLVHSNNAN